MTEATTSPPPPTEDEKKSLDELIEHMTTLTGILKREADYMQRTRIRFGYGAIAVACTAFAGLCVATTVTDFMFSGMQCALFAGLSFVLLRGPR